MLYSVATIVGVALAKNMSQGRPLLGALLSPPRGTSVPQAPDFFCHTRSAVTSLTFLRQRCLPAPRHLCFQLSSLLARSFLAVALQLCSPASSRPPCPLSLVSNVACLCRTQSAPWVGLWLSPVEGKFQEVGLVSGIRCWSSVGMAWLLSEWLLKWVQSPLSELT